MIYRGCVMKVEKEFAIVMTDTMEYLKVVKKEGLRVGGQIIFVKEDIYKEKTMGFKPVLSIAAILVIFIMSVTLSGLFSTGFIVNGAAAVVSVDINPSMELEINKKCEVIRVIALNDEAKELIDENIKGMNIEEAIWIIIEKAEMKNYITKEKNSVLISTAIIKEGFQLDPIKLEEKTEKKWKEKNEDTELNLLYVEGSKEDLKEARKQEVSMGKYEVFKSSMENNKSLTIEEIKSIKVQEINDKKLLKSNKKNDKDRPEEKNENRTKDNKIKDNKIKDNITKENNKNINNQEKITKEKKTPNTKKKNTQNKEDKDTKEKKYEENSSNKNKDILKKENDRDDRAKKNPPKDKGEKDSGKVNNNSKNNKEKSNKNK